MLHTMLHTITTILFVVWIICGLLAALCTFACVLDGNPTDKDGALILYTFSIAVVAFVLWLALVILFGW